MEAITFPSNYQFGMTLEEVKRYWPSLDSNKFHFTSEKTIAYNCLNWAITEDKDLWMDMFYFQTVHDLDTEALDHSAQGYAEVLEKFYGFSFCDNGSLEIGVEKVALYEDRNGDWAHIARQFDNGNWTSKIGKFEDIEHYSLEALNGRLYGEPKIYMKRDRKS